MNIRAQNKMGASETRRFCHALKESDGINLDCNEGQKDPDRQGLAK